MSPRQLNYALHDGVVSLIENNTQEVESLVIMVKIKTFHKIVPDNGENTSPTAEKCQIHVIDVVLSNCLVCSILQRWLCGR
jgi:hypothetical protein